MTHFRSTRIQTAVTLILFCILIPSSLVLASESILLDESHPTKVIEGRFWTQDWIPITITDPGTLTLQVQAEEGLSIHLTLYDVNETRVMTRQTSGQESYREIQQAGLAPGTYYAQIQMSRGQGNYTFTTSFDAIKIPGDKEPNDTWDQAQEIDLDQATTGHLGFGNHEGTDTVDWFKVTTTDPGTLTVLVEAQESLNIHLVLFDGNGTTRLESQAQGFESERIAHRAGLRPGVYYIQVQRTRGHGGYTLTPTFEPLTIPEDQEPNDEWQLAQEIMLDQPVTGHLGFGNYTGTDTVDWFKVTTTDPGTLTVQVEAQESLNIHLYLNDGNGTSRLESQARGIESNREVQRGGLKPGLYYIQIQRNRGHGGYTLTTSLETPPIPGDQEPNDIWQQAQPIELDQEVPGQLGFGNYTGTDTIDWFKFTIDQPGEIRVEAEAQASLSIRLYLVDSNGTRVLARDDSGQESSRTLERSEMEPGIYYVRINQTRGYGGYHLHVFFQADPDDPSEEEPPTIEPDPPLMPPRDPQTEPKPATKADPAEETEPALSIPPSTPEMVLVKGGTFQMGDEVGDLTFPTRPVHQVTLTYDYLIGKYEVTFEEYDTFCDETGRIKPSDRGWGRETRPVINVSLWDAIAYCNWLSERAGLPVAYILLGERNQARLLDADGNITGDITQVVGYRLPTEAEWEYAARGGHKSTENFKYAGSSNVDEVAWYTSNSGRKTQLVGQKKPNELGLFDMSGNAWELCYDEFDMYFYEKGDKINPIARFDISPYTPVARGGGALSLARDCRVAFRDGGPAPLGFRIARTVVP